MKKLITILFAACLLFNNPVIINANSIATTSTIGSTSDSGTTKWPKDAPPVTSDAAIVMDASTGAILYSKNIHQEFYPASITKILTTLLAIENSSLSEIVTFSKKAVFDVDLDSSRIGIDVGEELTMEQSLYGILLASANEVAYAVAEHISGDVNSFADFMNARAKELGCTNTHFVNPNGLPDPNHYTSAFDMALISRAAINNDIFRKITGTRTYIIPETNIQEETRYLANHHKFVVNKSSFDGCIGGKTGYTTIAKYTLVTFAERNGMTLISVIMHCNSIQNEYLDTSTLLNYGFKNYSLYNIAEIEEPNSSDSSSLFTKYSSLFSGTNSRLQINSNDNIILPNNATYSEAKKEVTLTPISAIVEGSNVIGRVTYTYDGGYVGSADIIFNNIKTPSLLEGTFIPLPTAVLEAQTYDTANELVSDSNNSKPIIIGIIVGILALVLGLYIIFIELPLRRRRTNYQKRRRR